MTVFLLPGAPRPKRKLSPPPPNVRDYSAQPEKFVSLAEHIAHIQTKTPARFRSRCISDAKRRVLTNSRFKVTLTSSAADQQSNVTATSHQNVTDMTVKALKVPRWPAPKVEPLQHVQYTPKEASINVCSDAFEQFAIPLHYMLYFLPASKDYPFQSGRPESSETLVQPEDSNKDNIETN